MTNPDTSQQRAAVDPEARDSLVHRTRVDTIIWVVGGIISTCGLGAIVTGIALWSTVQTQAARLDALTSRIVQVETTRAADAHDLQAVRDAVAEVRADTRVIRTQLDLTVRALNADGASSR